MESGRRRHRPERCEAAVRAVWSLHSTQEFAESQAPVEVVVLADPWDRDDGWVYCTVATRLNGIDRPISSLRWQPGRIEWERVSDPRHDREWIPIKG